MSVYSQITAGMLYALAPSKDLLCTLAYYNLIKSLIVKNPANLFLIQAFQIFLKYEFFLYVTHINICFTEHFEKC